VTLAPGSHYAHGARAALTLRAAEMRTRCWRVGPGRLAAVTDRAAETTTRCWRVGPELAAAGSERAAASEHAEGAAAGTARGAFDFVKIGCCEE
jgi:hypothetical protein